MAKKEAAPEVGAKNVTPEEARFIKEHEDQLSKTTVKYAKWIHGRDEHEDRPGQSLATRDPEVIRQWVEARDGRPATVPDTEHDGRPGVLRFIFDEGGEGGRLQEISWDDFFGVFTDRELVFIYQEHKADGSDSNFFRFDNPNREDA